MAIGCYNPDDVYLDASYKGVPFQAIEADSNHGRRGAEGEFPFGETTGYADLGRRIRTYSMHGRFDGNDHVDRAEDLIRAVETAGPGILVHPTRGVLSSVACKSLKVSDKVEKEQGVTYVDLEFVEANKWPNGLVLSVDFLGISLTAVIGAARLAFTANYVPSEIQSFRETDVVAVARGQVANIATQYANATASQDDDTARNRIVYDLNAIAASHDEASVTETMDKALSLGMNAIAQNLNAEDKFQAFRTLANGAAGASTFNSPAADAENAVYSLVRTLSAAFMAQAAMETTDYRTGQLFDLHDIVVSILDEELEHAKTTCQNHLYRELLEFRTTAAAQIANKAYNAPGLVEYEFGGQVHPLVAAYSIYGDAKRHRELERLNVVGERGRIGTTVVGVGI